jgi:hypothetical protein
MFPKCQKPTPLALAGRDVAINKMKRVIAIIEKQFCLVLRIASPAVRFLRQSQKRSQVLKNLIASASVIELLVNR